MHSGLTLQLAVCISTNVLQEQLRSYWWSDNFVLNNKNALASPATHCREKSAIKAPRADLTVGTVPTVSSHKLRGISSFILLLQQLKWLLSVLCCHKNQQEQINAPGGFGTTQSFFLPHPHLLPVCATNDAGVQHDLLNNAAFRDLQKKRL